MKRFALNFICKNESHIITRMLEAIRPITDLIVAVDTGSTDDTIAIIRSFGHSNGIPTYVFERPFDDFGNSRNYALEKLRATVLSLHWDPEQTWGIRMDCDEKIDLGASFDKQALSCDLYFAFLHYKDYGSETESKRQLFFRLSRNFEWEGPVHETLTFDREKVTMGDLEEVKIIREPVGASWKTDQEEKYARWAGWLVKYIENGHRTYTWVNHLADTYLSAAGQCQDPERKRQYLLQSKQSYKDLTTIDPKTRKKSYDTYRSLVRVQVLLRESFIDIKANLLDTYSMDKRHAEPIYSIVEHYLKTGQGAIAYLYSSFAVSQYHGSKPESEDSKEFDASIYNWKILYYHCFACYYTGRTSEASVSIAKLKEVLKEKSSTMDYKESAQIRGKLLRLKLSMLKRRLIHSFSD